MTEKENTGGIEAAANDPRAEAWIAAFERNEVDPSTVARAQFLGYNICIKIPEVFAAAVDAVKAGGSVFAAIALPGAWPATVPLAAWESYCATRSVFSALVEKMEPLEYITVAILATHRNGVAEDDLKSDVEAFVKDPNTRTFSWHLGMSEEIVDAARNDISSGSGWITRIVNDHLLKKAFARMEDGKVYPVSKNVEWKFGV